MSTNLAVVGAQWGDEGKGKVVDLVCERFDVVARYQGGPNAGHTVTIAGRRHALQHIPSGVFRPDKRIVIGNGTVLDLPHLIREIEGLEQVGVGLHGRLFISNRAHVILPIWTKIDTLNEKEAGELAKIGTTQRGIGPTYEGKAARLGIRIGDLDDETALIEKVRRLLDGVPGQRLRAVGEATGTAEEIAADLRTHAKVIAPYLADTTLLLNDWMDEGKSILFEGAQGTLLDLDHGSYPFVTSSSTVAGGLCAGLGVSPRRVDQIAGVFKAYCSRVGSGPMPTELDDGPQGFGELLRQRGREFGTVTGRPRRTGWFDGVAAAYANRINRFDAVCVMLLDVLDALDEIPVCTGYKLDGKTLRTFPATNAEASRIEPVFETLAGWHTDTTKIVRWEELPKAALHYLDRLGQIIGAEVALVSVGPDRAQTIVRPGSALWRRLA